MVRCILSVSLSKSDKPWYKNVLTRAGSDETVRLFFSLRRHQPEPRVLVEVGAEVVPRENARLVSGADEAPADDDVVLSVEARGRKVLRWSSRFITS